MKIRLPDDIVCVILDFDGALKMAIRRQYIECVYISVYREAFGWYFMKHSSGRALEMAKYCHKEKPWAIKKRKCRKYLEPWWRAFGKDLEIYLYKYGIWKHAMQTNCEIQHTVIEQMM